MAYKIVDGEYLYTADYKETEDGDGVKIATLYAGVYSSTANTYENLLLNMLLNESVDWGWGAIYLEKKDNSVYDVFVFLDENTNTVSRSKTIKLKSTEGVESENSLKIILSGRPSATTYVRYIAGFIRGITVIGEAIERDTADTYRLCKSFDIVELNSLMLIQSTIYNWPDYNGMRFNMEEDIQLSNTIDNMTIYGYTDVGEFNYVRPANSNTTISFIYKKEWNSSTTHTNMLKQIIKEEWRGNNSNIKNSYIENLSNISVSGSFQKFALGYCTLGSVITPSNNFKYVIYKAWNAYVKKSGAQYTMIITMPCSLSSSNTSFEEVDTWTVKIYGYWDTDFNQHNETFSLN